MIRTGSQGRIKTATAVIVGVGPAFGRGAAPERSGGEQDSTGHMKLDGARRGWVEGPVNNLPAVNNCRFYAQGCLEQPPIPQGYRRSGHRAIPRLTAGKTADDGRAKTRPDAGKDWPTPAGGRITGHARRAPSGSASGPGFDTGASTILSLDDAARVRYHAGGLGREHS